MTCPKCNSESCTKMPAEIRIYRNAPRTLSHPPVSPSPDIHVCMECGWSEFVIPPTWISAWLKPQPHHPQVLPTPLPAPQQLTPKHRRPIPVVVAS